MNLKSKVRLFKKSIKFFWEYDGRKSFILVLGVFQEHSGISRVGYKNSDTNLKIVFSERMTLYEPFFVLRKTTVWFSLFTINDAFSFLHIHRLEVRVREFVQNNIPTAIYGPFHHYIQVTPSKCEAIISIFFDFI